MDPIYFLPNDIQHLLVKLDQQWIDMIDIDMHLINTLNFRQISKELAHQLLKIKDEENVILDPNFRNLLFYTLFVDEQFHQIRDLLSDPLNTVDDLVWHYSTFWYIIDEPSITYELPEFTCEPETPLEEYMVNMIQHVAEDNEWDDEIYNHLVNFFNSHQKLIMNNLVRFGIFLSSGKNLRSLKPNHSMKINSFLEKLYQKHDLTYLNMFTYNHIGTMHFRIYEFKKSAEYYEKAIEIGEKINSHLVVGLRSNLAMAFSNTDPDEAIQIYQELMENHPDVPYPYFNIGRLYFDKGEYEKALQANRTYNEKFENTFVEKYITEQHALLKLGRIEEAKEVLVKARKIAEDKPVTRNTANLLYMEARQHVYEYNLGLGFKLYEKTKQKMYELGFLGGLFRYSIEKIELQLKYIDMYAKQNENARSDLISDITSLVQLADEQGIAYASIEGLWLRGRVHHQFGNIDQAKKDTYNAHKLADKFEFPDIAEKINQYRDELEVRDGTNKSSIWNSIKAGVKNLLSLNVGGEIEKEDYELHGVMIISQNGLPLFDHFFTKRFQSDPALVSGMIAAVSSFMNEITQSKGFLTGISHEDQSLVLETVHDFVVISIVSKETYDIRLKTKNFKYEVETILDEHNITSHPGEVTQALEKDLEEITKILA